MTSIQPAVRAPFPHAAARLARRGAACLAAGALLLAGCGGGGVETPTETGGSGGSGGGTGGGGTTVTPTAYALFASNYVAYSAQTNGAFLHSLQGGDVITGFGGNWNYGCYSSSQADMDRTQFYTLQGQADGNGNCGPVTGQAAPTTASDYVFIAIKAPGSNASGLTSIPPLDISQSASLLVQMGNTVAPDATHGHAGTVTIEMSNDPQGNPASATAVCAADVALGTIGAGAASALGVLNYEIPFTTFTCTTGSIAKLQATGVTVVALKYLGDKNATVVSGEYDTLAVGYVGFTK